jgi:hypothetical protein
MSPGGAIAAPDPASAPADPAPPGLKRLEQIALCGVLAVTVALVLGHRYLPMNDAPSHLANAVIARKLWQGDAFMAQHYQLLPVPLPYWAVALLMYPLQAVLPPLLAFRVLCALYVVLLPLSFFTLARAAGVPGNRPLTLVAALMAMNWAYFLGEANFFLGQPLVLFALSLFVAPRPLRGGRLIGFLLLSSGVYLCHIYALTALCGAMFGFAVVQLAQRRRLSAGQFVAAGWAVALFALAAYLVLFQHGTDANSGGHLAFDFSLRKAAHLFIDPLDSPTSPSRVVLLGFVLLLGLLLFAPRLPALRQSPLSTLRAALHLPMLVPALLLLAVAFLGPVGLVQGDGRLKEGEIAMRLLLCGVLLLLLGVRLPTARWVRPALLAGALLFAGFKLQDAYRLHRDYAQKVQAVSRELLARVPSESRLLPLMELSPPEAVAIDFLYHRIGNYVVVERHGYSPHVFAVLGQHPLRHRYFGDYRAVSQLKVSDDEWRFYDYVLIQTRAAAPAIAGLSGHTDFVAATGDFRLYRVRK